MTATLTLDDAVAELRHHARGVDCRCTRCRALDRVLAELARLQLQADHARGEATLARFERDTLSREVKRLQRAEVGA